MNHFIHKNNQEESCSAGMADAQTKTGSLETSISNPGNQPAAWRPVPTSAFSTIGKETTL